MELRQIQYFTQLYKDCNITKASQTLFISQQGLSKSIHNLEKELGFPLFERSVFGVSPTNSADRLYHLFQNVLTSYDSLNTEVENVRQNQNLRIAAPSGFSLACDKEKFLNYTNLYSKELPIYAECANHALPAYLREQRADIAFMPSPIPDELQSHVVVSKEPVYAIMTDTHPLASYQTVSIEDLKYQKLLLLDYYENFNTSLLHFADSKNIPYRIYKKSSINEFLPFIYSGGLIGFSTKSIFQHFHFPDILFIPMIQENGTNITIETHLVTLKDVLPTPKLQQYIEYEKGLHHAK